MKVKMVKEREKEIKNGKGKFKNEKKIICKIWNFLMLWLCLSEVLSLKMIATVVYGREGISKSHY